MAQLVDLSHTIEAGMATYPGLPGPVLTDHLSREDSRSLYDTGTEFHIGKIDMVSNTGTYLDTPFHRFETGWDLADLPLDTVVNLEGMCVRPEGPRITPQVLDGRDIAGRAVLFATGWDRYWRTERYGDSDHPFLASDTARALVSGGARVVGIDSVNIDDTAGGDRPAHTALLGAGIPIVEHLTRLDRLVGISFRFFAVPAKVRGLGSFPVRAFALLDQEPSAGG